MSYRSKAWIRAALEAEQEGESAGGGVADDQRMATMPGPTTRFLMLELGMTPMVKGGDDGAAGALRLATGDGRD